MYVFNAAKKSETFNTEKIVTQLKTKEHRPSSSALALEAHFKQKLVQDRDADKKLLFPENL